MICLVSEPYLKLVRTNLSYLSIAHFNIYVKLKCLKLLWDKRKATLAGPPSSLRFESLSQFSSVGRVPFRSRREASQDRWPKPWLFRYVSWSPGQACRSR